MRPERGTASLRLTSRPHGAAAARDRVPAGLLFNGRALRLDLGSARRELRLARLSRRRHGSDRRAADLRRAAAAARVSRDCLRCPREQRLAALLDDSRKFQNEVSRSSPSRCCTRSTSCCAASRPRTTPRTATLLREPLAERPGRGLPRPAHGDPAARLPALRRGARHARRATTTFVQLLLARRAVRAAARRRRPLPRHDGPALRRLGAAARAVPHGPRRRAAPASCELPPRHGVPVRPRPLPVPRRPRRCRSRGRPTSASSRRWCPTAPSTARSRSCSSSTASGISYRALDVEQIGSVYETMMGFRLERATGRSIAIKADKTHGAPTTIDLERCSRSGRQAREVAQGPRRPQAHGEASRRRVKDADDARRPARGARRRSIDHAARPTSCPPGAMVLQPSEERRRSGSHYTPRSLTEPIVRTTLEPILDAPARRRTPPRPSRSSSSRSATRRWARAHSSSRPAASSATRWSRPGRLTADVPEIPADEDEVVYARRLVAQRCLYGVDKNPVAVDLAKLSLWLATLARDHAFTFLDHALRHGDSLVGLTRARSRRSTGTKPAPPRFRGDPDQRASRRELAELRSADPRGRRRHVSIRSCATCGTRRRTSSARCGYSAIS